MTRRSKAIHTIIVPIALLVMIAMAVVVAFILFSAKKQDEIARNDSIKSVSGALDRNLTHLERIAKDFAWWNEAVENLVMSVDLEWADQGIGFYAFENYGYETSFVIDGQNRTIYSSMNAERMDLEAFSVLRFGLETLVESARALSEDKPEPSGGLLKTADGKILLVGVSAIAPEDGATFQLPSGPKHVLIFTKELNQELLDSIGGALPLEGLRLARANASAAGGDAILPLMAPDGTELGTLVWQPHEPGRQFLESVTPALAIAIIVIAAFTYAVLRHARETTGAIEASEARFRDVADASSDWIWEVDATLRLTFISERYALVTGELPEASLGMPLAGAVPSRREPRALAPVYRTTSSAGARSATSSRCARTPTASTVPSASPASRSSTPPARPIGYRGTATDITAEIEAGRRAEYLAMHDALTGLPNRVLLLERLDQAIASVSRRRDMAALLLLDLDRFKDVNDTLGHPAGRSPPARRSQCGSAPACARSTPSPASAATSSRSCWWASTTPPTPNCSVAACSRSFRPRSSSTATRSWSRSASASLLIPIDGSMPRQLLQLADIALYRAKEEGRNATRFFEPEMDARLQRRKALERELRLALTRDELELYYQPKISLRTDELAGVEALVRWHHPERGLVPPVEFIGIAEETGLILQLGEWVLRTACRQAPRWPDLEVSVNISPAQFRQPDLVQIVHSAIRDSGLAAASPRARDHRERPDPAARRRGEAAGRPEGARRARRHGRLRHRVLEPQLPAALPLRQDQDRPLVHLGDRQGTDRESDRPGRHQSRHPASAW